MMLCSSEVLIAVRGTVDLPIFMVGMRDLCCQAGTRRKS